MGMTIIEKILARASGAAKLAPGDLAVVDVDLSVLIDLSFSRGSWREVLKVYNPEDVVVVFDHDVPASNRETAAMHVRGRDFVRRFGIRRFHDVGPDQGISHVVVAENAYCLPGTVMACSDSHTCSAGALNCAARGLGAPDLLYAVTTSSARACRQRMCSCTSRGRMATTPTRMSSSAAPPFLISASMRGAR